MMRRNSLTVFTIYLVIAIKADTSCGSVLAECGGDFSSNSGTFTSPSFLTPDAPKNNESCDWRITGDLDERIVLHITDMDIEKVANCTVGYVEVRDGHWSESPLLGRFCGMGRLEPVMTTRNEMLITYVYNNRYGHSGFSADFEAICGEDVFTDNETYFASPNYPDPYPLNKKCIWKIEVHRYMKAAIKFHFFDVENEENCLSDYVEIRDGLSEDGSLIGVYCNSEIPNEIIASGNFLYVKFVSDSSVQRLGFAATVLNDVDECASLFHECEQICINTVGSYKCACNPGFELHSDGKTCNETCGGIVNTTYGTIQSPLYPSEYPLNTTCIWQLYNAPQNQMGINFTYFDIEGGTLNNTNVCNKDRLEIYTIVNASQEHQVVYCGNATPEIVYHKENMIKIVFYSDHSVQKTGFVFDYFSYGCSINNANCLHGCLNNTGTTECVCGEGYVLQNNGRDCIKTNCSYEISSLSGNVSSPNFPQSYNVNQQCWWQITTTPGHRILLTFLNFTTEATYDVLTIYDGNSTSDVTMGTFSGSGLPAAKTSSHNELYMIFVSDSSKVSTGFFATYSSVCNATLTASSTEEQYIYSHADYGYSDYPLSVDCQWIISTGSDYVVTVSFPVFSVDSGLECPNDSVTIFDGPNSTAPVIAKLCDEQPPPSFISSRGASLTVLFHSDESVADKGFALVYKATEKPFV
ncbi:CUB, FXa inhibition, and/or EGF CA domain containing protein [Asbolus verrucosus]|uniref:CUB, FXa inhibition, and/or EGF CA domain containing protein n=1 Tax=Asbolus verrucosus TaxID=1661398 RepID=A0A482V7E0_ASBVE|nr:CUB, FXa inhibition, and/or EGF CA domain containing protein [Asbolus verrucosus]